MTTPFSEAVARVTDGADAYHEAADLVAAMTVEERLGCLDGDTPFWPGLVDITSGGYHRHTWPAARVPRLGVPGIEFADGPRGCVLGDATAFPVSMARGATFDPALEERVGEAIGAELRASGATFTGAVCMNLLRHPAWGRAQETYGEDPHHVGVMAVALTLGLQRHVMACMKHFALNSMENARFSVDVSADERALHEVYLPHFERVAGEGVASVMSAYNSVNGHWCGENAALLTDVLRREWGWDGFVISDFVFGLRDPVASVLAGLDIEMPFRQQRAMHLPSALDDGRLTLDHVDAAVTRIVATLLRFAPALASQPSPDVIGCGEHRALAREVAVASAVLLRNDDGLLPLEAARVRRVAVVGRLAAVVNLGDGGSSDVRSTRVVTPLDGLRAEFGGAAVVHSDDDASIAAGADLAVVVVGYTKDDEGEFIGQAAEGTGPPIDGFPPADHPELGVQAPLPVYGGVADPPAPPTRSSTGPSTGPSAGRAGDGSTNEGAVDGSDDPGLAPDLAPGGDRRSLRLSAAHEALIAQTVAVNARTVVVVQAGSAVVMPWAGDAPAIVQMWYAGVEGGSALADLLVGRSEPGGRLPFAVPTDPDHLVPFDRDASAVSYDLLHGQWRLDADGRPAQFPFGAGLGYTEMEIVDADWVAGDATVTSTVANRGDRDGSTVVFVFAGLAGSSVERPPRRLIGFARVAVAEGGTATVRIDLDWPLLDVRRDGTWWTEPGEYDVDVGLHAGDPAARRLTTHRGE